MTLNERYLNAKKALFDKAYSSLNDMQKSAVFTVNNPLLVIAGAGSGKTTVLVRRIAFIIKYGNAYNSTYVPYGVDESHVSDLEKAVEGADKDELEAILSEFASSPCEPWRMLAITFTNKAAKEIKDRLAVEIGNEDLSREIWAGTFHSVCMRILRVHGEKIGYRQGFSIYDADDSKKAIASAMKALNIDEKAFPIKSVATVISDAKNRLLTPEMFADEAGNDFRLKKIAAIYKQYQTTMAQSNVLDFDDIIMKTVELLAKHEDVRQNYQSRFKYVCVDEYQDTNGAQFRLTELLAGGYRNLMVVGDDDQSIYKFRGATIENILNFDRVFKDATVIKLEQNYRSTQTILDAANAVIKNNRGRRGKNLWTSAGEGDKIYVKKTEDHNSEARFIVDKINTYVSSKKAEYKDFAVLYRNNAQSSTIEKTFAKSGVPYRMLGGTRFNDRKEIRDIVAYLHVIENHDDRERLLRIINEPKRKIGDKTLEAVEEIAKEQGCSMFDVIERADSFKALEKSAGKLMEFANLINYLGNIAEDVSIEALIRETLERSGYRQMLIDGGEQEQERLDNLDEFISGAIDYEKSLENDPDISPTLFGFLEENALVADVDKYDDKADAVVLMTVHSSKGLEFPIVFLPGMEDGIFPGSQATMGSEAEIEEERRLAYVAITRAKKELFITHVNSRLLYGRTSYNPESRFLKEIPEELVKRDAPVSEMRRLNSLPFDSGYDRPRYERVTISRPAQSASPIGKKEIFAEGDVVEHVTFGRGEILSAKIVGADTLYEIAFDKVGTKKLMASFAKLKKV